MRHEGDLTVTGLRKVGFVKAGVCPELSKGVHRSQCAHQVLIQSAQDTQYSAGEARALCA
jgi:hypothetical protein